MLKMSALIIFILISYAQANQNNKTYKCQIKCAADYSLWEDNNNLIQIGLFEIEKIGTNIKETFSFAMNDCNNDQFEKKISDYFRYNPTVAFEKILEGPFAFNPSLQTIDYDVLHKLEQYGATETNSCIQL